MYATDPVHTVEELRISDEQFITRVRSKIISLRTVLEDFCNSTFSRDGLPIIWLEDTLTLSSEVVSLVYARRRTLSNLFKSLFFV